MSSFLGIRIRESGLMPPGKIALEQDGKIVRVIDIDELAEHGEIIDGVVMSEYDARRLERQIQKKPVDSAS